MYVYILIARPIRRSANDRTIKGYVRYVEVKRFIE